jgi:hypothetical protein
MIITGRSLPRRTVLRGMGACLALPFLDAMVPAFAATRTSAAAPIRRFGALYVGNGVNMSLWAQPADGTLTMNPIIASLSGVRDNLLVVTGLDMKQALSNDGGNHPRAQAAWLTGCRARRTDGPDLFLGVSMDQIVAKEFSKGTQLGSIELAMEPTDLAGNCGFGFSCAYANTLAWRSPTNPLPVEANPRNLFERLFGASESTDRSVRLRDLGLQSSILDDVTQQIRGLRRGLGPKDHQKLEEYLDSVRDVERRIEKAEQQSAQQMPVVDKPAGIPDNFGEHARLMLDLQVLAFQTDLTRVFTIVLAREASVRSYPEIGVSDSHHPLSHHQNIPEKLARLAKLNAYHVSQAGYFADKLKATADGDGTLLDHTLLLVGSGFSDGNVHTPENVPTVVVAGNGFGIPGNRTVHCPAGTPLANLHLTLLDKLGVPIEKLGDSNGEINLIHGV